MDIRDLLVDGIAQLAEWTEDALKDLSAEQMNFLAEGMTTSIGFSAWHVYRTADNITNFVLQQKQPIWLAQDYVTRMNLPKVAQGTGMGMEDARGITIADPALLLEYGRIVLDDSIAYIKRTPLADLEPIQMIKPLGEMPRWRVMRQVLMTHGFMHLGEINVLRGMMGLRFSI